jgi:hypothetical protein
MPNWLVHCHNVEGHDRRIPPSAAMERLIVLTELQYGQGDPPRTPAHSPRKASSVQSENGGPARVRFSLAEDVADAIDPKQNFAGPLRREGTNPPSMIIA